MTDEPRNRRSGERYVACFPAEVARDDGKIHPSMIRDLSEEGALVLLATTKLAVGDAVTLQLYIAGDRDTFRTARGTVVRVEDVPVDRVGPWRRRIAVHFDTPLTMYAEEIARFRERAAAFG